MASRKRQRREFEESALVHLDAIYRAALRLARDPADAQDLSQEVFLRAYRSFHQYERGTNCRAWLFKILKNAFINRERSMSQSRAMSRLMTRRRAENPGWRKPPRRRGEARRTACSAR